MIDLYDVADVLSETLPSDAVVLTDSGFCELIIPKTVEFKGNQRCIHQPNTGTMGVALPASIGVHFAGAKNIVCVVGDGSIMMNLQELQTIKHHNIPVRIIVINNNAYGVIRSRQKGLFRTRTIGTDPSNGVSCPDFGSVAQCFGMPYCKVGNKSSLEWALTSWFSKKEPVFCEIICDENQELREGLNG